MDERMQAKLLIDAAWRRCWWIVVPMFLGLAVSIVVAKMIPKVYRGSTTILVMRQSIPEEIIRTTVTTRVEERIRSLKIQVKSRRYLEQVVKDLEIVPANATQSELDRACSHLSSMINLDWDKQGLSWFNITVDDGSAKRAADIANRLAELFIEQNSALRAAQAKGTVETVEGWLETTEKELRKRDADLARFRAKNLYELPDQETATLQLLNAAQARIQQLTGDIQMRSERLVAAQADDTARRASAGALGVPAVGDDADTRSLAQMQRELQDLLTNYTDENPLVKRKRDQIAQFVANHPVLTPPQSGDRDGVARRSPEVARLEGDIRRLEADREREQHSVDVLRRRIENMPLRQQELAALTRDYETLQHQYDANFAQKEQAKRAQDIESAKKGEQFQIQDRASPATTPFAPKPLQIVLLGLLGGLGLGVGLAALLEFIDQTVRNEEEFAHRFPDLPILGSIPNLDVDATAPGGLMGRYVRSKTTAGVFFLAAAATHLILVVGGPLA